MPAVREVRRVAHFAESALVGLIVGASLGYFLSRTTASNEDLKRNMAIFMKQQKKEEEERISEQDELMKDLTIEFHKHTATAEFAKNELLKMQNECRSDRDEKCSTRKKEIIKKLLIAMDGGDIAATSA